MYENTFSISFTVKVVNIQVMFSAVIATDHWNMTLQLTIGTWQSVKCNDGFKKSLVILQVEWNSK